MPRVDQVAVHHLRLPLRKPYHTALGDITHFDAIIAQVRSQGRWCSGEACPVPGYSWESPDDTWQAATAAAQRLVGLALDQALAELDALRPRCPFAATALATAVEQLLDPGAYQPSQPCRVPLVGTVNAARAAEVEGEVSTLLAQGYTTLKVKVGFAVADDLERVRLVQRVAAGRAAIRLDANQGYTFSEAWDFVTGLDPQGIQFLEQPFPPDAWELTERLCRCSPLPIMLDESIYDLSDVERAAAAGARYVKFKLMKAGSAQWLARHVQLAQRLGLEVVVGNGVATDLGCYHEVVAAQRAGVTLALESNGFLKISRHLLHPPLAFASGHVHLSPGCAHAPDLDQVAELACRSWTS